MKRTEAVSKDKLLIRACHSCLKLNESYQEQERCSHCSKSFLPLNYLEKIHHTRETNWQKHFSSSEHLEEEDLIRGIFVLW